MKSEKKTTRTLIKQAASQIGQMVTVKGWVETKRDHGQITFIDLKDRSGIIQVVGFKKLSEVTVQSVISVTGKVKKRAEEYINPDLETGEVEIEADSYQILNSSTDLPITMKSDGKEIKELPRLKYRYLDLRRDRLQRILRLRSEFTRALRDALYPHDFVEIETPMLTQSTKEGARDFIVPSRFYPGKFYALPQSPQQYKQLLMTAGFERYFQIARCIRDEDLRSDRGFEFTQVDLEMSFVNQQQVMDLIEQVVKQAVKQVGGNLQKNQFPVYTYQQALEEFGEDKFDLRTEAEKKQGVLAFAWVVDFPFFKQVDQDDAAEVLDSKSGWTFTHNPFSQPKPEFVKQHLEENKIDQILTTQYDLVCNGYEVGGGSIRAHQPEVLRTTFKIMGYSDQEIEQSVGHMLRAFELGTPPHGGIALGLDRLVMLLAGETSLKEVIAFPMTSTGRTAVMDAPTEVDQSQLTELSLEVIDQEGESVHDRILSRLQQQGVDFQYLVHEPVYTSEESAEVRGTTLAQAAKALVMQADDEFVLLVLPGDRRADIDSFKQHLGVKRLAMASKSSVAAKTGVEVGAVPPFGSVIQLSTYIDKKLLDQTQIAFNVGRHDRSIIMQLKDFIRVEKPEIVEL